MIDVTFSQLILRDSGISVHLMEHKIEELKNSKERELDTLFKDLLSVVDAYEKAEARLDEQYSDNEAVIKAKKRFSTSKKKLMEILRKNGVSEIQFPDGYAKMDDCQIVETEPDATKENDTIISIEKAGFRRNGRLLSAVITFVTCSIANG